MDPRVDRKNGNLYIWANLLIFLAAPVRYPGITQAALFDKLGASATLANLPTSVYYLGGIAPIIVACLLPQRLEKRALVMTATSVTVLLALVTAALFLPLANGWRIGIVVGQCLLLGLLNSVQQVYLWQCLGRGTTEQGRARAVKLAFTFGPLAAVTGSLAAQFILRGGIPWLRFPGDFALLYFIGVPASAIMVWCCNGFELRDPEGEEAKPRFFIHLFESVRDYWRTPSLMLLAAAYFCWWFTFMALPNLSLYARHALGREPAAFSGLMMAIQFGSKALAGYGFGVLLQRCGVKSSLLASLAGVGLALLWGWTVPGYPFLIAFAFMGAGQLGGAYFPNAVLSWFPSSVAPRRMAVLGLAGVAASAGPTVHGMVTDHWGFPASFMIGIGTALLGLALVRRLPAKPGPAVAAA